MLKIALISGAALAWSVSAAAQSTDVLVEEIATLAREASGHSRPPVANAVDQQTVRRGALLAQVQACGGDWSKSSYLPYMARLRGSGRFTERQLAYLGIVHGIAQQVTFRSLNQRAEPCSARTRAALRSASTR